MHVDVLIVGAGLSGIGAAHHLQTLCPKKTYVILEGREASGGTWDLFRYPGIRSDSDMYTLGYSFKPWTDPKAIADGPSILRYVRETAAEAGIDRHIHYRHKVVRASWSSDAARWTVEAENGETGETVRFTCSFLFSCTGYYDYEGGYAPEFPGRERFQGRVVHPQTWTDDVDYEGKKVVVIGSGATAVTLVPELAKKAAHVTMLQRSPTYIVSVPDRDPIANWMRGRLPARAAYSITRWKNVALAMGVYQVCRRFPAQATRFLIGQAKRQLNGKVDVSPHFTPEYKPWDQRLCLVPNGDLFKALRGGRASVVTDHIETFTEKGIRLKSGAELEADVVVTATGLKLKMVGGMHLEVDGERVEIPKRMAYRGFMLSDVPNFALAIGYTNASWTLKCDLTSEAVCRMLAHMEANGFTTARPRVKEGSVDDAPLLDLSSGYVQRSRGELPRQGTASPWRVRQNYLLDKLEVGRAKLEDGVLEFGRSRAPAGPSAGADCVAQPIAHRRPRPHTTKDQEDL